MHTCIFRTQHSSCLRAYLGTGRNHRSSMPPRRCGSTGPCHTSARLRVQGPVVLSNPLVYSHRQNHAFLQWRALGQPRLQANSTLRLLRFWVEHFDPTRVQLVGPSMAKLTGLSSDWTLSRALHCMGFRGACKPHTPLEAHMVLLLLVSYCTTDRSQYLCSWSRRTC